MWCVLSSPWTGYPVIHSHSILYQLCNAIVCILRGSLSVFLEPQRLAAIPSFAHVVGGDLVVVYLMDLDGAS